MNDFDEFTPPRGTFGFGMKAALYIAAFIVVLAVIIGVLSFTFGWFGAGARIVSPENVTAQFQQAYDDINALNAIAANICIDVKARDAYPKSSDGWTTNEQAVVAQEQNFQRVQNHYNAYIHDPFRAKLVRPRDLPDPAPTEAEAIAALGGGCTV